ncbi:hypothetical protein GD416_01200 [Burkholderia sp. BE24]|nr:hypothetical protein [Burkholderia sp. BE24]
MDRRFIQVEFGPHTVDVPEGGGYDRSRMKPVARRARRIHDHASRRGRGCATGPESADAFKGLR